MKQHSNENYYLQICEKHQELWLYNVGIKTTSILYLWYKQVTTQTFMTWHNVFIKLRLRAMTNEEALLHNPFIEKKFPLSLQWSTWNETYSGSLPIWFLFINMYRKNGWLQLWFISLVIIRAQIINLTPEAVYSKVMCTISERYIEPLTFLTTCSTVDSLLNTKNKYTFKISRGNPCGF